MKQTSTHTKQSLRALLLLPFLLGVLSSPASAQSKPAATATIDVCHDTVSGEWLYAGAVAVNGSGLRDSSVVQVEYWVDNKTTDAGYQPVLRVPKVSAATSIGNTRTQTFSIAAQALPLGSLRASSQIVVADLLSPGAPLALAAGQEFALAVCGCPKPTGCTRTQGYWKSKPGVVWPAPTTRGTTFFSSGKSWQQVLETAPQGGNGYLILAHQYIAAKLNLASNASAPAGVLSVIEKARAYFASGATIDSCGGSACETQKTWAGILDTYNNGQYPGAPKHCPD